MTAIAYNTALMDIEKRAERARKRLLDAESDVTHFEALCNILRDHGLEFAAEVYASEVGMQYWIRLYEIHSEFVRDMLATLAALDCEEKSLKVSEEGQAMHFTFASEHAPEFNLFIRCQFLAAAPLKFNKEASHA